MKKAIAFQYGKVCSQKTVCLEGAAVLFASLCVHTREGVSLMRGRGESGISFEELGALLGITSAKVGGAERETHNLPNIE